MIHEIWSDLVILLPRRIICILVVFIADGRRSWLELRVAQAGDIAGRDVVHDAL